MFLISLTAFIVFSAVSLLLELASVTNESLDVAMRLRLHVSLIVPICLMFLLLVGLLLAFHCFLVVKNVTTHEYLKDAYNLG